MSATGSRARLRRPVAGHEWYPTEHDPQGRPFRWSGPLSHSTVDLRVDTRADLEVELRVLDAIRPDVLDGLRLEVHGTAIPLRSQPATDGGRRFSGLIPQRLAAAGERHRVRLDLHAPRTVSPRDVGRGSGDARRLGIALSWLTLRRTSAESVTHVAQPNGISHSRMIGALRRLASRRGRG